MFLTLSGAELEAIENLEERNSFILNAFSEYNETAKEIISNSPAIHNVYAYLYDAGMVGTSSIRFLITTDNEEEVLKNLYDELRNHVENYSMHWLDYNAETEDEVEQYQSELDQHLENAMAYVVPYDPKLHNMKIPGGSRTVQFELLY